MKNYSSTSVLQFSAVLVGQVSTRPKGSYTTLVDAVPHRIDHPKVASQLLWISLVVGQTEARVVPKEVARHIRRMHSSYWM